MSKKFWTFKPNPYFAKQLPSGGRNEIFWAAFGCAAYFWYRTRDWNTNNTQERGKVQQKVNGSTWF